MTSASRPSGSAVTPAGADRRLPPRRAGRPSHRILSRTIITVAAMQLIGDNGYAGLTMAALARRLEVAPSALYNHADSKRDVLRWVQDHVITMVDVGAFGAQPWADALRRWAWSYRDVFARHTPLIPVIAVLPAAGAPATVKMYETVAESFRDAGWAEARIVPAITAIESFIFGSAFYTAAAADIFDPGERAKSEPVFRSAVRAGESGTEAADTAFGLGLDAMIAGLSSQGGAFPDSPQRPPPGLQPARAGVDAGGDRAPAHAGQ